MSEKPLKFAVVREDPHVELALLERFAVDERPPEGLAVAGHANRWRMRALIGVSS